MVRIQYGETIGTRLDQREMAKLAGLPPSSWAAWESGVSAPRDLFGTIQKIVDLTGVHAAWLLGLDGLDPNTSTRLVPIGDRSAAKHVDNQVNHLSLVAA